MEIEESTQDTVNSSTIIKLNVGGHIFQTTKATLLSKTQKLNFFDGLLNKNNPTLKDSNDNYFIDRDGKVFAIILQYLRTGKITMPKDLDWDLIKEESDFYLIDLPEQPNCPVKYFGAYVCNNDWKEAFIFQEASCIVLRKSQINEFQWSNCEQFLSLEKSYSGVFSHSGETLTITPFDSLTKEALNYFFHRSKKPKLEKPYTKIHGDTTITSIIFYPETCYVFSEEKKFLFGTSHLAEYLPIVWYEDKLHKAVVLLSEETSAEIIFFGEWLYLIVANKLNILLIK